MRLYLIRHGETVDNVRQLYAGSRNSELTNHGVQQATRLGQYLAERGTNVTHIFCSPLLRAQRTAELILLGQGPSAQNLTSFTQHSELVEQDFGSLEGVSWAKPVQLKVGADYVPVESKTSLAARCDIFLQERLFPLLVAELETLTEKIVAVVSHGITLSTLWKRLYLKLPPNSVRLAAHLGVDRSMSLDHLGGWSNTGFIELVLQAASVPESVPSLYTPTTQPPEGAGNLASGTTDESKTLQQLGSNSATVDSQVVGLLWHRFSCLIESINSVEHLRDLKRTKGGIGSSKFDKNQTSLDSFFRKRDG